MIYLLTDFISCREMLMKLGRLSCMGWPSRLTWSSVTAVLTFLSCSDRLVLSLLSRLSCHRCPVLVFRPVPALLSRLSYTTWPIPAVLSRLASPDCPVQPFYAGCPALTVLSLLSWAVLSQLPCIGCPGLFLHDFPILAVLTVLDCPYMAVLSVSKLVKLLVKISIRFLMPSNVYAFRFFKS